MGTEDEGHETWIETGSVRGDPTVNPWGLILVMLTVILAVGGLFYWLAL